MRARFPASRRRRRVLFGPETLEKRIAPALLLVTSASDSGPGTLRDVVATANINGEADTIEFDLPTETHGEIELQTQIVISGTDALAINGPTYPLSIVNKDSRIFDITEEAGEVSLRRMKLTGVLTNLNEDGGAIRTLSDASLGLHQVTVMDSRATGSGGAISILEGKLLIENSFIDANRSEGSGGGVHSDSGTIRVLNSTFANNITRGTWANGGGIATETGNVELANSTFSANGTSRGLGGAMYSRGGSMTITNTTITDNVSHGFGLLGGGLHWAGEDETASLSVVNSIISGNRAYDTDGNDLVYPTGRNVDIRHSLIGDNTGTDLIEARMAENGNIVGTLDAPIDARLTELGYHGGFAPVHALLENSPAVNAGDSDTEFTTDQRHQPFARNDGNGVDMGAYERQTVHHLSHPLIVTTLTDRRDIVRGNLLDSLSLREAVELSNGSLGENVVTFQEGLSGTISLELGQLEIQDSTTLNGPGPHLLQIDGQQKSRVISIPVISAVDVTIRGLMVSNGATAAPGYGLEKKPIKSGPGAGISFESTGSLRISNSRIVQNVTGSNGGGVAVVARDGGEVIVLESVFADNVAIGSGGAIYSSGDDVAVYDSSIVRNEGSGCGGGIAAVNGNTMVSNSTVSGNVVHGERAHGGGICTFDARVAGTTIVQNAAVGQSALGGGISAESISLLSTIVAENTSAGNLHADLSESYYASPYVGAINSIIGSNSGTRLNPSPDGGADENGNLIGTIDQPVFPGVAPLHVTSNGMEVHRLLPDSLAIDRGLSAYHATVKADSPNVYYRFDGANDGIATDSGFGRTPAVNRGYTTSTESASSPLGKAAAFDGVDDYFLATEFRTHQICSPQSIEFWFNAVDTDVGDILSLENSRRKELISLEPDGDRFTLHADFDGVKLRAEGIESGWHHVVVTNGRQSAIYVDGELRAFLRSSGCSWGFDPIQLHIGASNIGGYGLRGNFFHGSLDEVALYNEQLTPDQISRHYMAGIKGLDQRSRFRSIDISSIPNGTGSDGTDVGATEFVPIDLGSSEFAIHSDHVNFGVTEVTFSIKNDGDEETSAFRTHLTWSTDPILGNGDDQIVSGTEQNFPGLSPGETETRRLEVRLNRQQLYAHAKSADPPGEVTGTASQEIGYLLVIVDVGNEVAEANETNNSGFVKGKQADDFTYFPWDLDGNGVVTPRDARRMISSIGSRDFQKDLNGDGVVTALEALDVLQRIGYRRNNVVSEFTAASDVMNTTELLPNISASSFGVKQQEEAGQLFANLSASEEEQFLMPEPKLLAAVDYYYKSTDWLSIL